MTCTECGRHHDNRPRINPRTGKPQQFDLCDKCFEIWASRVMRQSDPEAARTPYYTQIG